jgi:exopolysaccharide biosynthesis polyprenyl glycosylphosphotransferase
MLVGALLVANLELLPERWVDFLSLRITIEDVLLAALLLFAWPKIFAVLRLYDSRHIRSPRAERYAIILACTCGSALALLFAATSSSSAFGPKAFALFWLGTIAFTLTMRTALRTLVAEAGQRPRQAIIIGSGPRALSLYHRLRTCPLQQCEVLGFVDANGEHTDDMVRPKLLGHLDQLEELLMHQALDEVLIALPIKSCYGQVQTTLEVCERVGVKAKFPADVFRSSLARTSYEAGDELPFVTLGIAPDDYRLAIKRAIDVVGAVAGIVLLSPVMLAAAVAIKVTSPGPIFFIQQRYGLNRRQFRMYKLRTMVTKAEELQGNLECRNEVPGPVFKIKDDPRLTRIGRFLRRSSIDEVPQLFNVLRGQMSLVGPRPLPERDVHRFTESWLMRRFSVRPGLTCLWQVRGRSQVGFDRWIGLDLQYIDGWSLTQDVKILLMTIPAVIKGVGAE